MLTLQCLHHIAIICSDYPRSKKFYTEVLGFSVLREVYREERQSWKLDLALDGIYLVELFSFPGSPARPSHPEACGLRHLAFSIPDIAAAITWLQEKGISPEEIRTDPYTQKRFTFFADPDGLPVELYEN